LASLAPAGRGRWKGANQEELALKIIQRALELGVNYFDTSAIYGGPDRWSERYLGKGLKGSRDRVFFATKTKERTRDAALKNLDVSLKLLDTDHIDSWQLHDVGIQEDTDQIFNLLNLALGGQWPKDPDATTQFPLQMLVDYVRVYTHG
jgi:uncharacterized protein